MNDLASVVLWGILVFTLLGLFFGVALASAARRFHVPVNPLVEQVSENLPSANCGACGFAGCAAYAERVVEDPEVAPSLCAPGGESIAIEIGTLTGKPVGEIRDEVAMLRCYGTDSLAKQQAEYDGVRTCSAAVLAFGGPKSCKFGCIGLGDCVQVCRFDAMVIGDSGIVEIDHQKCTGCAVCIDACPKHVLAMYPRAHRVVLSCQTADRGKAVKEVCSVGCIQCQLCIKECPADAISLVNGAISIDHVACNAYGRGCGEACVAVCPTEIIHLPSSLPVVDKKKPPKEKSPRGPQQPVAKAG
jgi:electron transport complex protein RnfB